MRKLILFELKKIFSRRLTQAALAAVLVLSAFLSFSGYQSKYAFDGKGREGTGREAVAIDREIAAKYAGPLTDEKVQAMMADFAPKSDLHGMNAAYLYQNAIQAAAFARFADMDGNWNGRSVSEVFGGEEIRLGYIDGWLTTSQNMVRSFLVLALVIIVMTAPVFSGEYGSVDPVIFASKYGRTKCGAAKVWASISAAFLVTLAVAAENLVLAFVFYGGGGLDCSILFAERTFTEGYIPFNITCGTLLGYQVLLAFTGTMSAAGITMLVSALSRNQTAAVVTAAVIYLLPAVLPLSETSPLFRYLGLLPLYHAQFVSLMSVERMSGGILYAAWAVPAVFAFLGIGAFSSRKVFAGHEVM